MPLLRIDVTEGRSAEELNMLLDAIHDAVKKAFAVPEGDRYQIVTSHPASELRILDTGLGIQRSLHAVIIQVITRPRPRSEKENFYRIVSILLGERCGIRSEDVVISCTENSDEDWSFGYGRAQFLTGEL